MEYKASIDRLSEFRREIASIRKKMREIQAGIEPEVVKDYEFSTPQGTTRLSALFDGRRDLILIHNMGKSCSYCTLWADGYNGVYHHLMSRASFVISSPDAPEVQQQFAAGRGWQFPMVSHQGTSFAEDMGYRSKKGGFMPGISVFRKDGNRIVRVSEASLSPMDDFCTVWHILDLFPEGADGWAPKMAYAAPGCCSDHD